MIKSDKFKGLGKRERGASSRSASEKIDNVEFYRKEANQSDRRQPEIKRTAPMFVAPMTVLEMYEPSKSIPVKTEKVESCKIL